MRRLPRFVEDGLRRDDGLVVEEVVLGARVRVPLVAWKPTARHLEPDSMAGQERVRRGIQSESEYVRPVGFQQVRHRQRLPEPRSEGPVAQEARRISSGITSTSRACQSVSSADDDATTRSRQVPRHLRAPTARWTCSRGHRIVRQGSSRRLARPEAATTRKRGRVGRTGSGRGLRRAAAPGEDAVTRGAVRVPVAVEEVSNELVPGSGQSDPVHHSLAPITNTWTGSSSVLASAPVSQRS